ncbi:RNA-directed DNA polymerase [Gregarina niphandrodes]|uniref:RNA-directed DNA polymerase n=1 Tax=Gregarina niphandrodes TaxID=110365 RepID=A0A023B4N2_GRENI|nr:RNA-directed DNA polymerase [Gregarina niphandrodes]EZG56861.1 RNA-directed DNA polymerase [Gregarina niphandrodes]|eukprot:XP_011131127.1 RNA-directed DNA polymerase [Gregarina niphandrodes]
MQAMGPVVAWAAGQKNLAKMDLSKAFHAIPVAEDQMNYAILDSRGQAYRYRRMPMGAMCAPKHFSMVMGKVLGELSDYDKVHVRSYQDDVVVISVTEWDVCEIWQVGTALKFTIRSRRQPTTGTGLHPTE